MAVAFFKTVSATLKALANKGPLAAAGAGILAAATDPDIRKVIKESGKRAGIWLGQGLAGFSMYYYFRQQRDEAERKTEVTIIVKELSEAKQALEDMQHGMRKMLEEELRKMQEGINRSIAAAILEATTSSSSGRSSARGSVGTEEGDLGAE